MEGAGVWVLQETWRKTTKISPKLEVLTYLSQASLSFFTTEFLPSMLSLQVQSWATDTGRSWEAGANAEPQFSPEGVWVSPRHLERRWLVPAQPSPAILGSLLSRALLGTVAVPLPEYSSPLPGVTDYLFQLQGLGPWPRPRRAPPTTPLGQLAVKGIRPPLKVPPVPPGSLIPGGGACFTSTHLSSAAAPSWLPAALPSHFWADAGLLGAVWIRSSWPLCSMLGLPQVLAVSSWCCGPQGFLPSRRWGSFWGSSPLLPLIIQSPSKASPRLGTHSWLPQRLGTHCCCFQW